MPGAYDDVELGEARSQGFSKSDPNVDLLTQNKSFFKRNFAFGSPHLFFN